MMAESKDAGKTLAEAEIDDEGIYSSLFYNFDKWKCDRKARPHML